MTSGSDGASTADGFDALLPPAVARKAEDAGVAKANMRIVVSDFARLARPDAAWM